jgi:uncharacterized protein (DUF433 family)
LHQSISLASKREVVLDLLAAGHSMNQLIDNLKGRVPQKAIEEAIQYYTKFKGQIHTIAWPEKP